MKKKKRIGIDRRKFLFDNKYMIPDLKYPILESESIFDSQPNSGYKKPDSNNLRMLMSFPAAQADVIEQG